MFVFPFNSGYLAGNDEWKCKVGDRLGCGVVIDDKSISSRSPKDQAVYIYATKNGKLLHVLGDILPLSGYYPTVFLQNKGQDVFKPMDIL